jgi:hypothetical protein
VVNPAQKNLLGEIERSFQRLAEMEGWLEESEFPNKRHHEGSTLAHFGLSPLDRP